MYKVFIFALLLLLGSAQDTILSSSGSSQAEIEVSDSTDASELPTQTQSYATLDSRDRTTLTSTVYTSMIAKPTSWSFLNSNPLGGESKWITIDGSFDEKERRKVAKYTITFYVDCPESTVTLVYASTGQSYVSLNGNWEVTGGSPYPSKINKVTLSQRNLKCGCNKLTIYVYNYWWASPAAVIYSISQNTAGCYNCTNLGVTFYNRETCQCQCASKPYEIENTGKTWLDYPQCGYSCSQELSCPQNKFFNRQSCSCDCSPKCCPSGFFQDQYSCTCKKQLYCLMVYDCKIGYYFDYSKCDCSPKCQNITKCPAGQSYNYETCQCECSSIARCAYPLTWNPNTCSCSCPKQSQCAEPWGWNPLSCSCECQIMCIATMSVDQQNCRCVPIGYPISTPILTVEPTIIKPLDSILTFNNKV